MKKKVQYDDKDHHWMDGNFRDSGKVGWFCVLIIGGAIIFLIMIGWY